MFKKLAKIKYLPNNFEIIENGDYVFVLLVEKNSFRETKLLEC